MGVGDQVPAALQQLGVNLSLIDPDELAWGDLSKYHTIVTGVRAYERRADLRANNHRLLQYVENGGTVVVQYNKMEFNQAQYGPLPRAGELRPHHRRTRAGQGAGAGAPGVHLAQSHRRMQRGRAGCRSAASTSSATRTPKYVDLVEMEDPFPYNKGAKRGALVEARHGKGRWLYVGLGLWRQLPAGTDGAYKLMANLVSLGKAVTDNPNSQLPTSKDPNLEATHLALELGCWELGIGVGSLTYFSNRIFPRINMSSVSFSSFAFAADSTSPPASRTPLKRRASMSKATK